jgi:hypothetical protein
VGRLELALELAPAAEALEVKVRNAMRPGSRERVAADVRLRAAVQAGVIAVQDADLLQRFERLRRACIMVDDFPPDIGRNAAAETGPASAPRETMLARKTA